MRHHQHHAVAGRQRILHVLDAGGPEPTLELLVGQARRVEGVEPVARVPLERLTCGGDHERIVDGPAEDLRLILRHGGAHAGERLERQAARHREEATPSPFGQRASEPADPPVGLEGEGLSPGLVPPHARSSRATWLVRTIAARRDNAAAAHTVHVSHPNNSPIVTSAYRTPRVT